MNAAPRRGGRGITGHGALRFVAACALWITLTSLSVSPARRDEVKAFVGVAGSVPEGSVNVQVREHEVLGMRVTEVILGRAAFDEELPTVVQFHGRADRPTVPTGDHSTTRPVRMLLPWAPEPLGEGFTWFPLSITERDKPEKILGHHIRERSDEVAKVLTEMMRRRPTEGGLLVSGFSQGGMMTFALALRHPELVDGAFPVAGWLPSFLIDELLVDGGLDPAVKYPPIHAMHGRGDPIVPYRPTSALIDRLRALGLPATMELFVWDEHSMSLEMHARHRELMLDLIRSRRSERHDLG